MTTALPNAGQPPPAPAPEARSTDGLPDVPTRPRELRPPLPGLASEAAEGAWDAARSSRWGRARRLVPWGVLAAAAAWIAGIALCAAALALAWWFVQPQLGKPYVYDEADFAFAGHAVATLGLPYANVGHIQEETPGDFSKRFNWALWHPPLYVYVLGLAFRHWGETEHTARSVGIACNALAAVLLFLTAVVLLRRSTRGAPLYAATAVLLYASSPLVQQSALLLDIDGTVLVASLALLTLVMVLLLGSARPLRHPLTALLLGLCAFSFALSLWAKMTTALAVVAAAALYRLVATRPWQPWRAIAEPLVIGGAGGLLFLTTWLGFALLHGMPFWFPFRILQLELAEAAGSTRAWRTQPELLLQLVSSVALWVSPYLVVLFCWAALARLHDLTLAPLVRLARRLLRTVRAAIWQRRPAGNLVGAVEPAREGEGWGVRPIDAVLLCGGVVALAYLMKLAGSFPKYHVSMMPFWALGVAYLLRRQVPALTWWEVPVYGIVLAGMTGYFVSFVGDRFVLFRGWDFVVPLLAGPGALGLAFLILSAALGRHHLPRQLALLGLLLTLSWSWGVDLAQARAGYSTAYHYGVTGQRETAAYLDTILRPDEPYVAAREVAYYAADQHFVDQDVWWAELERLSARGLATFDGRLLDYDVDVLALFLWDPNLGEIAHRFLDADQGGKYEVAYQAGPYLVFVRTVR